jgi:hypothetical protein
MTEYTINKAPAPVAWRAANSRNGPFSLLKTKPRGWGFIEPLYTSPPAQAAKVTDALIEIGCRAICARNGWNPDEPATYSGTHTKCRNRDGSLVPQWSMHANDVRAALEAAITPKEQP